MSGLLLSERIVSISPSFESKLTLICRNPCRFQHTHLQLDAWRLYLSKQEIVITNDYESSLNTDYKVVHVHVSTCTCKYMYILQ